MSIQCFWYGFPDSHLEFGPAVVWPHEGSNGDFRIHMQNCFSDLGLCIFFKPFCTFQPRVALHVACRSARTQGGVNEIRSGHRPVFFASHGFMHCWLRIFFCNNSRLSLMHRFCASGMASKHMRGALQFISGRFGLNFGIQNFHL